MAVNRCAAHCSCHSLLSRRTFLSTAAGAAGAVLVGGCGPAGLDPSPAPIRLNGPASKLSPSIRAAFVRRKGEYGMRWPGAVYDGEAARKLYTDKLNQAAAGARARIEIRTEPLFSLAETDAWLASASADKVDGVVLVLLDRQEHAWPSAAKTIDSGIPAVIYSPLGTSFTTNTTPLADKTGCVIYCTDDFSQPAYGIKMLAARARMRATRCVVLRGAKRQEGVLADTGISLQYVPASTFLEVYNAIPENDEVRAIADQYIRRARRLGGGASHQDVLNGVRGYVTARRILQDEQADAITMDCLGALGKSKVSLPCIAWSRMNDEGVPAACEADLGAVASHVMVQYLFDRPGFQQDPVAETAREAIIGAHCSCPTRLNGFDQPGEPFDLLHHHGNRDAVPRTLWRVGGPITVLDVLPGAKDKPTELIISSGQTIENLDVPPAGGCVVSVMVKLDGVREVLSYPGFHQLFFYGNCRRELADFCRLCKFQAQVV